MLTVNASQCVRNHGTLSTMAWALASACTANHSADLSITDTLFLLAKRHRIVALLAPVCYCPELWKEKLLRKLMGTHAGNTVCNKQELPWCLHFGIRQPKKNVLNVKCMAHAWSSSFHALVAGDTVAAK